MKHIGDILGSINPLGNEPEARGARPSAGGRLSRPPDEVCPICKGKGYLVRDVPPGDPDFSKVFPCRCTQARIAQQRAQTLRSVSNLSQLSRMTFDSFIPGGENFPPDIRLNLQTAYDMAYEFAREPRGWLVLVGGYGCGKTHLAVAIANHQLALGNPVMFIVVPDLLDYLRGAFSPDSATSLDERLEAIRDCPLLVLDDLGAHNSTPWAQEKLFQIINHRYNGRLPTVFTMNQRLEELDPRIASRLGDMDLSQRYEIVASDFRGSERNTASSLSTLHLHADHTFESFSVRPDLPIDWQENLKAALSRARAFAEHPLGWLVYSGTNGCGKTHLAAAIGNYQRQVACQSHMGDRTPMFVVVPDLLDHLRATFSPTSDVTLDRIFEQVRSAPLLILDDLGMESATPWAREKLFQLLNHRYVARLPTVITTSHNITEIEPWLQSRMLDTSRCVFFLMQVPSYRGSFSQRETGSWENGASRASTSPHPKRPTRGQSKPDSRPRSTTKRQY